MATTIIHAANQAVTIIDNEEGHVMAFLSVNTRNGMLGSDITNIRWSGSTAKGATRWANKQLGIAK
jgi:hypothetical protein